MSKVLILGSFITAMFYSNVAQPTTAPLEAAIAPTTTTTVSITVPVSTTTAPPKKVVVSTIPPTTAPPTTTTLPVGFQYPEWIALAINVGWPEDQLKFLDKVIHRESRGIPTVHNTDDPASGSRGLTQINGFWCRPNSDYKHPAGWLGHEGVVDSCEELFDPETNLRSALAIWQYGVDRHRCGWGPWKTRGFNPCKKH
jgi:hypothetical protein